MPEILERVRRIVIRNLEAEPETVTCDANFFGDLGADSLAIIELVMAFEKEFRVEFSDDAAEQIQTVADAVRFIRERAA